MNKTMEKAIQKELKKDIWQRLSYDSKEEVAAVNGKSLSIRSCEIVNENYVPGNPDSPYRYTGMLIGKGGPEAIRVDIENVNKLRREINRFLKWHQKYHEDEEPSA